MCAVIRSLTHDFGRLVALLKSCNGNFILWIDFVPELSCSARLQQEIARPSAQVMTPADVKALSILIFIVALLGEHCDFERLRVENSGAPIPQFLPILLTHFLVLAAELDRITHVSPFPCFDESVQQQSPGFRH
jgi:hypothetical protein